MSATKVWTKLPIEESKLIRMHSFDQTCCQHDRRRIDELLHWQYYKYRNDCWCSSRSILLVGSWSVMGGNVGLSTLHVRFFLPKRNDAGPTLAGWPTLRLHGSMASKGRGK